MKNTKGVSVIIGYVLLITFAMIMGTIVYNVIKTYIPKDLPECPESISLFIKEIKYTTDGDTYKLNITLINNGLFNIEGYFIRATKDPDQEIAIQDLSGFLIKSQDSKEVNNVVIFARGTTPQDNLLKPNEKTTQVFQLTQRIYSIEIIPVRFQEEENKNRFVSCGGSKIREVVTISVEEGEEACVLDCGDRVCGPAPNRCEGPNGCGLQCEGENECNPLGQCVPPDECTYTCESEGYECGGEICGTDCTNINPCAPTEVCNSIFKCEIACGNGVIDTGEACDDGYSDDGDGCSSICEVEIGWTCDNEDMPSVCEAIGGYSCEDYCQDLQIEYTGGICTSNTGQCTSYPGDNKGQGLYCDNNYYCCCFPPS